MAERNEERERSNLGTPDGNGKTLAYRLPRRQGENGLLLPELRKSGESANYKGRVLVMDDEEIIRTILCVMLMAFGYETHLTADGEETIRSYSIAKEAGYPFDAVIIDLKIPGGMGGKETMRRLLEIDPHVKAIVLSGNADDHGMTNFWEYGFRGVLHKPYSVSELRQVLNNVITGGTKEVAPDIRNSVRN